MERKQPSGPASSHLSLILPALCHPHIHLDKAYLLTSNAAQPLVSENTKIPERVEDLPNYDDLTPQTNSFNEAMRLTAKAKERYTISDLLLRGSQLIVESINHGVTSVRAFVEIDKQTEFKTLEAAIELKQKFASHCHIQICAFAQENIMNPQLGGLNRHLMLQALHSEKYAQFIDVLGTTPYVEDTWEGSIENIKWAIEIALLKNLHLDLHLDYNLDTSQRVMTVEVIKLLHEANWTQRSSIDRSGQPQRPKRITLGHCTRLTLLRDGEMQELANMIGDLPLSFVGLPTSDLFMMGRPPAADNNIGTQCTGNRPRGTLHVLDLIKNHGLSACMGVNNVGNGFTPWGGPDPLRLASLGVGIYQAGTVEDAELLYECVSSRARQAIGLEAGESVKQTIKGHLQTLMVNPIPAGGVLIVRNEESTNLEDLRIPARQRLSVKDVVWDPPGDHLRRVIFDPKTSSS